MSNRSPSENSDSISLFPFLAVLLCTMGALLVLLVVLVQRAAEEASLAQISELSEDTTTDSSLESPEDSAKLQKELAEIAAYQQQLAALQAEANERLASAQLRLSHSEEHTRRLEEELARLAIAAAQLKQTEDNQSVDQEQAEREAARLEQLVADTQKQIEDLRAQSGGKHSYAIVPYKGPNGTYRRPIYIECSAQGITLHPEGIRLTAEDFAAPNWPGNPLAAALRASREYLNGKAAKGGDQTPPDPYPLMIVRPDGIKQYALARAAITSWDSDYGYEFIDQEMKLSFPEAADPQLAHAQQHAVFIARDRLLQLAQAAPSRFRGMGLGGGTSSAFGEGETPGGYGFADSGSTGEESDRYLAGNQNGSQNGSGQADSDGDSPPTGAASPEGDAGPTTGPTQELAGTPGNTHSALASAGGTTGNGASSPGDGSPEGNPEGTWEGGSAQPANTDQNLVGSRYAQNQSQPGNPSSATGGAEGTSASGAGGAQQARGSLAGGASQSSANGATPSLNFSNKPAESIAASQGANWAVDRTSHHAVPIRRSIRVVVRENQIAFLSTKNASHAPETPGQIISLDQPMDEISNQFVTALRERIAEWGLAGSGMYWRPVLELHVGPDAQLTASRVTSLLHNSGVDIQLPETAENPVTPTPREGALR